MPRWHRAACPALGLALGLALWLAAAPAAWADPDPDAAAPSRLHIDEPRAYGYVVGDLIERHARIALPPGQDIAPDQLPRPGRVDAWLELRRIAVEPAPQGEAALHLVYQLINAPQKVTTIELPPLQLALRERGRPGSAAGSLDIGAWPVTVAPLTPEFVLSRAGLQDLQPDIAPQPAVLAPRLLRLALWSSLLALCLFAWAVQRYPQLAVWRRQAPFRRAWLDLRRMARQPAAGPDLQRRALERMHRAFDAAAGCALFAERLEPLYQARPGLREAAAEIDAFFAASRRRFFMALPAEGGSAQAGTPAGAGPAEPAAVMALCRRLAQLETRA